MAPRLEDQVDRKHEPGGIDLFEEATGEILDGPADVARRGR
jgi:hypothetical protein